MPKLANKTSLFYVRLDIYLGGCPEKSADFEKLVNLAGTGEKRTEGVQFGNHATDGPHIDGAIVIGRVEQDFGSSIPIENGPNNVDGDEYCQIQSITDRLFTVPSGGYVVGEWRSRPDLSGQTKVTQLDHFGPVA